MPAPVDLPVSLVQGFKASPEANSMDMALEPDAEAVGAELEIEEGGDGAEETGTKLGKERQRSWSKDRSKAKKSRSRSRSQ